MYVILYAKIHSSEANFKISQHRFIYFHSFLLVNACPASIRLCSRQPGKLFLVRTIINLVTSSRNGGFVPIHRNFYLIRIQQNFANSIFKNGCHLRNRTDIWHKVFCSAFQNLKEQSFFLQYSIAWYFYFLLVYPAVFLSGLPRAFCGDSLLIKEVSSQLLVIYKLMPIKNWRIINGNFTSLLSNKPFVNDCLYFG